MRIFSVLPQRLAVDWRCLARTAPPLRERDNKHLHVIQVVRFQFIHIFQQHFGCSCLFIDSKDCRGRQEDGSRDVLAAFCYDCDLIQFHSLI